MNSEGGGASVAGSISIIAGGSASAQPSSLKCYQILSPPAKAIAVDGGSKKDDLTYVPDSVAWQCQFSRDGKWLAACFGAPDPVIRVWQLVEQDSNTTTKPTTTMAATTTTPTTSSANATINSTSGGGGGDGGSTVGTDDNNSTNKNDLWVLAATLRGVHVRTIRSLAFAPINNPVILASASFDGTVVVWEYSEEMNMDWECMAQLEGHDNEVKCVTWNGTGSLLASCGRDKTVWVWECFLPGTVGGSSGGDGDFECIAVLSAHDGDVKCVEFAPSHDVWGDGDEIILSASYDETIKVWAEDAGEWYCAASISNVHTSTIWSLSVAPGGLRLISASADGSLAIIKCYSGEEKKIHFPDEVNDGSSGLWKCVGKLPAAHALPIYSVQCAPSRAGHGRIVSAGADNRIQIYKEEMGSTSDTPVFSLDVAVPTLQGDINCITWHPFDGSILASACDDGTVRLWRYRANV